MPRRCASRATARTHGWWRPPWTPAPRAPAPTSDRARRAHRTPATPAVPLSGRPAPRHTARAPPPTPPTPPTRWRRRGATCSWRLNFGAHRGRADGEVAQDEADSHAPIHDELVARLEAEMVQAEDQSRLHLLNRGARAAAFGIAEMTEVGLASAHSRHLDAADLAIHQRKPLRLAGGMFDDQEPFLFGERYVFEWQRQPRRRTLEANDRMIQRFVVRGNRGEPPCFDVRAGPVLVEVGYSPA